MTTPCQTCQLIDCVNPPDFQTYSLETDAFFSPQFTFVVQCPPGYNCPVGTFPKTVTIPPGQFIIPGPIPPAGLSSFPVQLKCCTSTLTATVPAGSTTAQINAIMAGLFQQCASQQALCNAIARPPKPIPKSQIPFTNDLLSVVVCPLGGTPLFSNLPPNISLSGNTLSIAAGSKSSMISKADANSQAQTQLNAVAVTVTCQMGIDFNNLVWEFPNGYTNGGTATGGPSNSYHKAVAIVDGLVTVGNDDGWGNQALMSYTGPTTACHVTLTLMRFSGGNGSNQAQIHIFQDGGSLVSQSVQSFPTTINFTISAGVNSQIQIGIEPAGVGVIGVLVGCDLTLPGTNFEGVVKFEFFPHS